MSFCLKYNLSEAFTMKFVSIQIKQEPLLDFPFLCGVIKHGVLMSSPHCNNKEEEMAETTVTPLDGRTFEK